MSKFILTFGKGSLTYILSLAGIVYGFYGWYIGALDTETAKQYVWAALVAFGVRRAL